MNKINLSLCLCLFACQAFSQIKPENPDPFLFRPFTHSSSGKLKSSENILQGKSFYQSKSDWQTIIDTTWGPGRSLNEKLSVFDTYTKDLTLRFAGFTSLGIDPAEWDSIKASYRSRIDSSTSKGAFAGLMSRLAYDLHDVHVHAWDTTVLFTPLNPGIPVFCIGTVVTNHFGAVLTVLPDSSLLVLRTIENHPLSLQPGDIVLGYEGVPWRELVDELLESGIPTLSWSKGAKSALRHCELASAGMNWHLFETIDIVKYESGDTVHLPVAPMVTLPVPPLETDECLKDLMWYNEQLPVPGIPFPDPEELCNRAVTYGIVEGTNIGYIYLYIEMHQAYGKYYTTDEQFYKAVKSLLGTEGLIIDLRVNFGGLQLLDRAFNLLFNIRQPTLEDTIRCNQTDFNLCPITDYSWLGILNGSAKDPNLLFIPGNPMSWYDKPIAILTGPGCVSMGDIHAYRFGCHPMTRFFGKSTCASLSWSRDVYSYPEWILGHSLCDMYHVNDPHVFLNRREFPVDDSVWFDVESVAAGKDAVAEKAMDWIRNLSYAHDVKVNPVYVIPRIGTATITAKVENPNTHDLSVNASITSADSTITEIVSLFDDGHHNDGAVGDGTWGALWTVPDMKTIFTADVTTEDLTAATSRSITGAVKFTTIGPIIFDGITYKGSDTIPNCGEKIYFKVSLRNYDSTASMAKVTAKLTSLNPAFANLPDAYVGFADISPGEVSTHLTSFSMTISEDCPVNTNIPVKVEFYSDYYTIGIDTFTFTVHGPEITAEDDTICDGGQTNIVIKRAHELSQTVYYTYTSEPENAGAVTGFTSNTEGLSITKNILDTLYNTTEQSQRVVYTITPYLLRSDKSIGCEGTDLTVDILVEPWGESTEEISKSMARIYPNPAADILNIEILNTDGQEIEIELLTITGQVLYSRELNNSRNPLFKQIDIAGFAKGVYYVRIRQSGAVFNGKIIVQ